MVAYTSPDCLPYFECTDSPCLNTGTVCEPSSVFCDLTALLDLRLTSFDATAERTNAAVPFAKVARSAPQTIDTNIATSSRFVEWDTVLLDNNNMVDLTVDPNFINIRTTGIWHFEGYAIGVPPQTNGNTFEIELAERSGSFFAAGEVTFRTVSSAYDRFGDDQRIAQSEINTFGGAARGMRVTFTGTTGTGLISIEYAELTAYWIADLP